MAEVKYLLQGLDAAHNHEDLIKQYLSPPYQYESVIIYSAFTTAEAVLSIKAELEEYGNKACCIIGIRNGSTSKEGLEAIFDTGAKLYVVDTGSPFTLFHPKTFLGINTLTKRGTAIIGSANLTPGGFRRNIENSCIVSLDLTDANDKSFVDTFMNDFRMLLSTFDSENVLYITSKDIIRHLWEEGRIIDEDSQRNIIRIGANRGSQKIIKRMPIKMKTAPRKKSRRSPYPKNKARFPGNTISANLTEVWRSGPLSERDLTIPKNDKTNPTGSMLLKKGVYDIDFQKYFRQEVFKDLIWTPRSTHKPYFEYADAQFHFLIDGIEYPAYTLTIHYDTRTDTKSFQQRNGNTHLHWGTASSLVKNKNLLGKTLTLYRINQTTDEYLIEIKDPEDNE